MAHVAISDNIAKTILDKWGIKLSNKLSLTIDMNSDSIVNTTISKVLTQDGADDVANVLDEYYLVKQVTPDV